MPFELRTQIIMYGWRMPVRYDYVLQTNLHDNRSKNNCTRAHIQLAHTWRVEKKKENNFNGFLCILSSFWPSMDQISSHRLSPYLLLTFKKWSHFSFSFLFFVEKRAIRRAPGTHYINNWFRFSPWNHVITRRIVVHEPLRLRTDPGEIHWKWTIDACEILYKVDRHFSLPKY